MNSQARIFDISTRDQYPEALEAAEAVGGVATAGGSSTTTKHTEPGVCIPEEDANAIAQAYYNVFHCGIPSPIASLFYRAISAGMAADVITYAIDETAYARRPSPQYLRAIITRLLRQGLLTMEAVLESERQREQFFSSATQNQFNAFYRPNDNDMPW